MRQVESIMVLRLGALGDVVLCEPAVAALAARYPAARIDLVTRARYAELYRAHPAVHAVCTLETAPPRPDLAVDLHNRFDTRRLALRAPEELVREGESIVRANRAEVKILANHIIRGVEQDHAISFTGLAKGNMVVAGESMLIMEATPAAYLAIACNEALKAATVKLITVRPFGATGRLIMSGPESEIDSAAEAAVGILQMLNDERAAAA